MGGGTDILVLLVGEDVQSHHVDLGVSVLARLGRGHLHDLARTILDHDVAVLAQGRALHRKRGRRTRIAGREIVIIGHLELKRRQRESVIFTSRVARLVSLGNIYARPTLQEWTGDAAIGGPEPCAYRRSIGRGINPRR